MNQDYKLIGSSSTLEGLLQGAVKYWHGSNIRFEGEQVFNSKGLIEGFRVVQKGNRYRLEATV
jgi:hypothetical protein